MTQRNKNISLVIFSKTVAIRGEVKKLEQQKEAYQSAPAQLAALANKEKQLDQILQKNNVAGNSLQNNILKTLNTLSGESGFTIVAFEKPHVISGDDNRQQTTTYNFTLQGDYKALIEVIYKLEQKYSFGNVIQVDFQKQLP